MPSAITVSATEANRSFSKLFRAVCEGAEVTVTSRGRPIAKMVPIDGEFETRERMRAALNELKEQRARTPMKVIGPWTRDDLYDRDW